MLHVKHSSAAARRKSVALGKVADGGGGSGLRGRRGDFAVGLDAQLGQLLLHFAFAFQEELRLRGVEVDVYKRQFQYEPSAWVTIGGIRTNDRLQAIDGEGVAIPGLYVAGADNGTLMSAPYCDYEGYSLMCAYCGGRLAGQYAVETIDA